MLIDCVTLQRPNWKGTHSSYVVYSNSENHRKNIVIQSFMIDLIL